MGQVALISAAWNPHEPGVLSPLNAGQLTVLPAEKIGFGCMATVRFSISAHFQHSSWAQFLHSLPET